MAAVRDDFHTADLADKDIAMLDYAARLTTDPCNTRRSDLEPLRKAGFEDGEILDIVMVVAYYAYVNRLACGLGVELESYWRDDEP